jgi:hypothetical protein
LLLSGAPNTPLATITGAQIKNTVENLPRGTVVARGCEEFAESEKIRIE